MALSVFVSATGFIVANSIAGAMADILDRAGAVSALVGATQDGCGIIGSYHPTLTALRVQGGA